MVKVYTHSHSYDYPFPAVSLAYFLRYPNPYSTHVLSTDVISRHFDPDTQRLYTTRLHLKQSKLPAAVLKLLPKNILGNNQGPNGEAQNFILEKSVIDAREGWMETETKNLQYTGILTVVEKQRYTKLQADTGNGVSNGLLQGQESNQTDVTTSVTFQSRFGQQRPVSKRASITDSDEDATQKRGFFSSWSATALQRTIEATSMQRTRTALVKSKEGMNVVLERMRTGGLSAVLEGMRKDREILMDGAEAGGQKWKSIWRDGANGSQD